MEESPSKPLIHVSAFICDSLIKELLPRSDGGESVQLTAVRIGESFTVAPETINIHLPDGKVATALNYPNINFTIFVQAHGERRKFKVRVKGQKPGEEIQTLTPDFDCQTSGEVEGNNSALTIRIIMPTDKAGIYWFWIFVDDEIALKLPLQVRHSSPRKIPVEVSGSLGTAKES